VHNFLDAFKFIARNGQIPGEGHFTTLTYLSLVTLKISAIAMVISLVIALPIGVWLGHIHRGSFVAINIGNLWRALPSLAVLAIGVAILGLGLKNVLLALCVLAIPPIITNAYTGIDQVDPELVDAARGVGMTEWEIVRTLELPLAVPLLMAGVRTAALFVISTTTISALTGYHGTLGDIINNETSDHLPGVLGAAICIAALALIVEALLAVLQRALTPRGLRLAGVGEPSYSDT
jgi:osmoprotectant transport system permease protein